MSQCHNAIVHNVVMSLYNIIKICYVVTIHTHTLHSEFGSIYLARSQKSSHKSCLTSPCGQNDIMNLLKIHWTYSESWIDCYRPVPFY